MALNVLVTGAGGVLGRAVVAAAESAGHRVQRCGRRVDRDWARWDIAVDARPQGVDMVPDCVVHAAADTGALHMDITGSELMMATNVLGTWRVVEWCVKEGVPHLVLISSAIVYGQWQDTPKCEGNTVDPWTAGAYAASKWLAEQAAAGMRTAGLKLSILRMASLYGAGYVRGLPQRLMQAGRQEGVITIMRPDDDAFHLLHVDDSARTILRVIEHRTDGMWNIGGPALITLAELARACATATNAEIKITGESQRRRRILNWVDDSRARRELGHAPQVSLNMGIDQISKCERKWSNAS